ncbi:low molecular weight protein-tyrosine-phosphatase [Alicyclobacillus herbarius]|uniref:low molecular weight protein-tyrosine-phosphatase n=1 Tax=Alicyclobacillus herbarius TaxID=122960 RepID=UPI000686FB52|nr:low molecular weight protein-tyrosine-phosphatase [Alicyclobacillus herbarius]
MIRVLFVCLGNICRSPMAEAVFRQMLKEAGWADKVMVDSAGIGGWHVGERPHHGTLAVLERERIPSEGLRARQIHRTDLETFDYIVAMDDENLAGIRRISRQPRARVLRLLDLVEDVSDKNVPDPYYTGNFDEVYALVQKGCARLLELLAQEHGWIQSNRKAHGQG